MTHASSEDRVFLESLHNRLQAVAEEMGSVVLRTGFTVFVSGYRAARGTPPRGHFRDEARASCLQGRHALRACPSRAAAAVVVDARGGVRTGRNPSDAHVRGVCARPCACGRLCLARVVS